MTINKQYAEELSRQMDALEKENARLLSKIHMLESDVLPTIYKILSQRKKPAKKKRVK